MYGRYAPFRLYTDEPSKQQTSKRLSTADRVDPPSCVTIGYERAMFRRTETLSTCQESVMWPSKASFMSYDRRISYYAVVVS